MAQHPLLLPSATLRLSVSLHCFCRRLGQPRRPTLETARSGFSAAAGRAHRSAAAAGRGRRSAGEGARDRRSVAAADRARDRRSAEVADRGRHTCGHRSAAAADRGRRSVVVGDRTGRSGHRNAAAGRDRRSAGRRLCDTARAGAGVRGSVRGQGSRLPSRTRRRETTSVQISSGCELRTAGRRWAAVVVAWRRRAVLRIVAAVDNVAPTAGNRLACELVPHHVLGLVQGGLARSVRADDVEPLAQALHSGEGRQSACASLQSMPSA